jgi:hypothetical protein
MGASCIGVECHFQQYVSYSSEHGDQFYLPDIVESRWTLIKLATMLYVITNTLLKVSLNTNKTGHHVLRYN